MLTQTRFMQLRPLTDEEKDQIREAKSIAKDRINVLRAGLRQAAKDARSYRDRNAVKRDLDKLINEGFVSGNPVRLVNGEGLTLTVDYNWLRRFTRGLSRSEWGFELQILRDTPTGPVYAYIKYGHQHDPGRFGRARHYGLSPLHVRALDGIALPEFHV